VPRAFVVKKGRSALPQLLFGHTLPVVGDLDLENERLPAPARAKR